MVFDRAKVLSKKKSPLSLQTTAVCFSESVGEYFVTDFAVASSAGKQEIKKPGGGGRKKKIEYRKSKSKFESHFFRARVGRAKQRVLLLDWAIVLGVYFYVKRVFWRMA